MNRTAVYGSLLVALGLAVGFSLAWRGERDRVEPTGAPLAVSAASDQSLRAGEPESGGDWQATLLQRRLAQLTAQLAAEINERRRLEQQIERLATEVATLRGSRAESGGAVSPQPQSVAAAPPANAAADLASGAPGVTQMERALVAAGIDATTASEIKRRGDDLALSEIYLRDQATREGWLGTPRFAAEMAKIDQQRTPLRAEIGDDAYDRYLAALDHPNRVAVDDVLLESPAAVAGLQAGDVVLRYGETRIFSPSELVDATHSGTPGDTVRVEILRAGQRFEIEVPRGPLGVRVAASRGNPGEG